VTGGEVCESTVVVATALDAAPSSTAIFEFWAATDVRGPL
jgi:hypothetical protein